MIPEKMDMNQHPNTGKKESSKEVANWLNLKIIKAQIEQTRVTITNKNT